MNLKFKKILIIAAFSLFICFNVQAAGYQVEITLPGTTPTTTFTLPQYLSYIYFIGLGAVGIAALGMLVYGGFLYMLSDTVTSKDKAKDYITGALSGLVLGLAAYLILNTINPVLLQNQSPNLPSVTMMPSPPAPPSPQICAPISASACTDLHKKGGTTGNCATDCAALKGLCTPPNTNVCCCIPR